MKQFVGYQKGINLGGWLSQCCHTKEHYDSFITEDDFKVISTWELDHLRIPVDYNLLETQDGQPLESGMQYLQMAVDWCGKYGLNMILDLHKTAGYSFDDGEAESGFFESKALQERFYQLWERLAERFGGYYSRVAFELLNEVTDKAYLETWNCVAKTCVERIRKIAPDVQILVGGYWNNSVLSVPDLPMPFDDKIVYNFHCYEPLVFTHQGAGWVKNMPADYRLTYPKSALFYKNETDRLNTQGCGTPLMTAPDAQEAVYFEQFFAKALETANKRNVALYCGEYGVISLVDNSSTLAWYKSIHSTFEKYKIGRAAWSYKKMDFGIIDAERKEIFESIKALL